MQMHTETFIQPLHTKADNTKAMFIVDETLLLLSADPAGHALLERDDCLRVTLGHVCTGSHKHNVRLKEYITAGIVLDRFALFDRVALTLTPLQCFGGTRTTRQAILMVNVTKIEEDLVGLVSEASGLTRAESEVLRLIYKGLSTVEAARVARVAKSTVRTHLQRIFAKTETSRQSELVHFVATWRG